MLKNIFCHCVSEAPLKEARNVMERSRSVSVRTQQSPSLDTAIASFRYATFAMTT